MTVADDFLDTGPASVFMGQALTGTVSTTGTAILGVGTSFVTELAVGQMVYEQTKRGIRKIAAITDATHATLDVAFNSNLAALSTLYGMVDTGDTKGGIDVSWVTGTFKKETDRRGTVGEVISDRYAEVTIPFAEWKPENLRKATGETLALVVSAGKTLARGSSSIGLDLRALGVPAVIIPVINGILTTDPNRIIVFHFLCPSAETLSVKFARTEQRPIQAKFMAYGLASDGEIWYVGDNSIRP